MGEERKLGVKVKLKVLDRLMALGVLPENGNILSIRVVKELREALGVNAKEGETLKLRPTPDGKGMQWDDKADTGRVFELTRAEFAIIQDGLKKLNAEQKLTTEHLGLWDAMEAHAPAGDHTEIFAFLRDRPSRTPNPHQASRLDT